MKAYVLNVINGEDSFRIGVDTSHRNVAYHILSAGCQAALAGFGEAKASMLYKLTGPGGTLEYKYQGKTIKLVLEVI